MVSFVLIFCLSFFRLHFEFCYGVEFSYTLHWQKYRAYYASQWCMQFFQVENICIKCEKMRVQICGKQMRNPLYSLVFGRDFFSLSQHFTNKCFFYFVFGTFARKPQNYTFYEGNLRLVGLFFLSLKSKHHLILNRNMDIDCIIHLSQMKFIHRFSGATKCGQAVFSRFHLHIFQMIDS